MLTRVFEGFKSEQIDLAQSSIFVRYGGQGPPVLLLHGHPRTSATWHKVRRGWSRPVSRSCALICAGMAALAGPSRLRTTRRTRSGLSPPTWRAS